MPRIERPLWVAEQLEVALFEGLAHRVSAALHQLASRSRERRTADNLDAKLIEAVAALTAPALISLVMLLASGAPIGGPVVVSSVVVISLLFVPAAVSVWRKRGRAR